MVRVLKTVSRAYEPPVKCFREQKYCPSTPKKSGRQWENTLNLSETQGIVRSKPATECGGEHPKTPCVCYTQVAWAIGCCVRAAPFWGPLDKTNNR